MRENVIDQRKSWTEKTLRKEYDWKEIQKRKKRKADNSYKRKKEKQVKLKINQALEKEEKWMVIMGDKLLTILVLSHGTDLFT